MKHMTWSLVLGPMMIACGATSVASAVRTRAAHDFRCPVEQIQLTEAKAYYANDTGFVAEGCGRRDTYEGRCGWFHTNCDAIRSDSTSNWVYNQPEPGTTPVAEPSSAPAAPPHVSIALRNRCAHEVHLFYGQRPKYTSGRTGSIGALGTQNENLAPGQSIWIVNEKGEGLSVYTASAPAAGATPFVSLDILETCVGFMMR